MKKRYRASLRLKLVMLISVLAVITYSTSAFFIYGLYDKVQNLLGMSEMMFTILTLLLGIIWSGILAYFAAGFITKPLHNLEQAATLAASGEITNELVVSKSDDEVRSLGVAFETMLSNLRDMVHNIEQNFEDTNHSVQEIKKAAEQATQQAQIIGDTIGDISQGAENSSMAIQQTAEAVDQTTQLATQVQEKAQSSEEMSKHMLVTLGNSKDVIHSLVSGIQSIAKEQELSLEAVNRLETNAQKVDDIISLVGDIAEQTNLLALNASIEAARAGEHGKGFAVVAEEVRKLADESANAVQGISDLITNMQQDVTQVVKQISEQVEFARTEANKGEETNNAIANMSSSVNEVATAVSEITSLVDQQLTSLQETSQQSQEVSAIAEETSASAQQVNASVQEQTNLIENIDQISHALSENAQSLQQQIQRFKLNH
ncbi:methyl-accepting chemotaxis protein [Pontibacillus sp. HMF3514]|uniref:methyl-accepting chemotaxis protein n=1 Tax=Pontibacillus sp. HMF3514 TaxID=2692425 RepID=UPI0013201DEF|nr:methyl-accepting chemotaxis protein [Pontibacillus sp. HMF3514]QHE53810.1 HAMP domain-containing protein [Pontibacillus sp. HMF3514]